MPKERRRRIGAHDPSVKLAKRQFAVQDDAVEHVEIGTSAEASGADILKCMADNDVRPALKKKEKQQLRREALLERLETSHSPYSKSHSRRLKRKAREQIAGGLNDMQAAISALETPGVSAAVQAPTDAGEAVDEKVSKPRSKPGQIGEGKAAPLTKAQRKRALQMERLRHPMILSNPDFSTNPFQTIRTHAQNTLLKREIPK